MNEIYLEKIRSFEGFSAEAKWDYAQHSNGYGTKARFAGERLDRAEAEVRFRAEIDEARAIVERHAGEWDEGTKAALTSLTFNAGTKWISSGLGEALRNGDMSRVRECFVAYNKAQGEVLPGLVKRRLAEVEWIGARPPSAAAGAAAIVGAPGVVAAATGAAVERAIAHTTITPSLAAQSAYGPASRMHLAAGIPDIGADSGAKTDFLLDLTRALSWDQLLGMLLGMARESGETSTPGSRPGETERNSSSTI